MAGVPYPQRRGLSRASWCGAANRWRSASRSAIRRRPRVRSSARSCASSRRARSPTRRCWRSAATRCSPRCAATATRFGLAWLELSSGRFSVLEAEGERSARERDRATAAGGAARARAIAQPAGAHDASSASARRGISTCETATRSLCEQFADARSDGLRLRRSSARRRARPAACCSMYAIRRRPRCRTCAGCAPKSAATPCCSTQRRAAISSSTRVSADRPDCTLAAVLDRTATAMGGRELRRWLHRPLRDRRPVELRLQAIGTLIDKRAARRRCTNCCAHVGDIERGLARVALKTRAAARSRATARRARRVCRSCSACSPASIRRCCASSRAQPAPIRTFTRCWCARSSKQPPPILRDGGVIAAGYDAELDELQAHQRAQRSVPARSGSARARAQRHREPAARLQPRAGLLHRDQSQPRRHACRRTITAARR